MMEVAVTTGAISRAKLHSNHHHQQTNIQFFTARMPFMSPNQQCQSTEGKIITFHGLAHPKLTWGSSNWEIKTFLRMRFVVTQVCCEKNNGQYGR